MRRCEFIIQQAANNIIKNWFDNLQFTAKCFYDRITKAIPIKIFDVLNIKIYRRHNMKLGIIGASSRRGTLAAYAAGIKGCFEEIKLYDDKENVAAATAMDLNQALSATAAKASCASKIADMADCDVIFSVYSVNYQEVKDRKKELQMNYEMAVKACADIKKYCSNSVVIVSVNPVDTFTYVYRQLLGFDDSKVMGVGASDTVRFKWALGQVMGKSAKDFDALCAGKAGHGIQLYGDIKCGGEAFSLTEEQKKQVEDLCVSWFKDWGAQKAGISADITLANAFAEMAEAIALDKNMKMACSTTMASKLGYNDCAMTFDVIIGKGGIKEICTPAASEDEAGFLSLFAGKIKESIDSIER